MGVKRRIIRWVNRPKSGTAAPGDERARLNEAILLAIGKQQSELEDDFRLYDFYPRSVKIDLAKASIVDAGESAPGWVTYEVHIPWISEPAKGVIYAQVDARISGDEVRTSIDLLRVT